MGKYNIYAVGYGVDPDTGEIVTNKLCKSWDECQKFIKGVNGAKYKGFLTPTEAKEWLKQFNVNNDSDDIHSVLNELEKLITIDKTSNKVSDKTSDNFNNDIDKDFMNDKHLIGIHPNDNTATVWLKVEELIEIIKEHGNKVEVVEL